ncbi:MAG TPA: response regulator transcription factor [Candidatus Aminicenantes bacterium]|nr:response regulator transcription factor [Candidatus Aminicenantes bacterium]
MSSPEKPSAKKKKEEIKLLIYCPSDLILAGIINSIEMAKKIEVIGIEKTTIDSLLETIRQNQPDVVLFSNTEPVPNLREICKAIRDALGEGKRPQLLLLGTIPSHEEIVGLMNAGMRGYFDINDQSTQLSEAIQVVHRGEIWLPRDKMSNIMDRIISVVGKDLKEKSLDQLTPTEFQVLRLIGQGKSNEEIAQALFISKNTVRSHIKSIYTKLNTHSRLQLALYAINSALF